MDGQNLATNCLELHLRFMKSLEFNLQSCQIIINSYSAFNFALKDARQQSCLRLGPQSGSCGHVLVARSGVSQHVGQMKW